MLMPISSEFVALCRAQVALLTQGLGASLSVVYLTSELVKGARSQLVPVVAYPEILMDWEQDQMIPMLPGSAVPLESTRQTLADDIAIAPFIAEGSGTTFVESFSSPVPSVGSKRSEQLAGKAALVDQRQLVLPLIHDEVMLGLLVTQRGDRGWYAWEQAQVEEIARTLTIACLLDQRYQWVQQERQQEHLLQLQQRDLIDNLLHQFRNSLTALQTFGKLILKRLLPGNAGYELAGNIDREAARLRELSQQLEHVAGVAKSSPLSLPPAAEQSLMNAHRKLNDEADGAIDARAVPLLPSSGFLAGSDLFLERCLVETLLEPLLASAAAIAQEKSLTIHKQIPDDLPPVWANPQALREVLNNLLENALKYTPSGGDIFVVAEATEEQPWLEIAINDTGPGIPLQDLPHIFERHYRGVQAHSELSGSGLGLAIARSLIEQMQGTIQVFSPARTDRLKAAETVSSTPGPGTTFLVQLAVAVEEAEE
ncbi:MAG: sensor histidine kinase [Leptolyngbyaceae cyanobacterium RU_5_1]|nr:sensor histidine kinase [Leptolyngbyaceae cyanobacterium RU_5_1]